MKLFQFRRQHKETALKAKDIVSKAFKTDKQNTRYVAPYKVVETRNGWHVRTITKIPGQRSRLHTVTLLMPKGFSGTLNSCPDVAIDCDCSRYLFVWNYALNKQGAAIKDRTNGEPPVVTNPQEVPGCCKHSVVAIGTLAKLNPRWPSRVVTNDTSSGYGKPVKLSTMQEMVRRIRRG